MKAILISIKPQHVANILNKIKTLEIRKRFPSDYVGWVYIYCTKDSKQGFLYKHLVPKEFNNDSKIGNVIDCEWKIELLKNNSSFWEEEPPQQLNGKVVARFWCDKVEEIKYHFGYYDMDEWTESYILENSCLSAEELDDYLQASKEYNEKKVSRVYGKAIHITKLEIFNKPKEISEFKTHLGCNKTINCMFCKYYVFRKCTRHRYLTRAPQSFMFVEI